MSASPLTAKGSAIEDLPELWGGFARLVRPGLGISGFGVNIMNLPPDYATKSHDESASGQEELYVALAGSGAVVLDASGEPLPLDADHLAAVGPGVSRTLTSGSEGLRVLIVGGTPGRGYEPPAWSSGGAG
jgi:mannose-6-phosphate isomerase-like protein (cupin superfamily)